MKPGQIRAVLGFLHQVANPDKGVPGDAQLLDQWRNQRNSAAFEVLVWRHGSMVWNLCRRMLVREQDAEDAFQATFLTFVRKAATIGEGCYLGSWLYKVAYRTALAARSAAAKHTGHEELDAELPERGPDCQSLVEAEGWHELGPVLDEEVNRLPEKYRRPIVLCYLEGKTTDEAARDLGCPRGTVGTRLAWARERLRSRLARRGVALPAAGLLTLLVEKGAAASVPMPLVLSTVQATTFATVGKAIAAGVLSVRAAALTQSVLQAMFTSKLKTIAAVLFVLVILGSGAGRFAHQALAGVPGKEATRQANHATSRNVDEPSLPLAPPHFVSSPPAGRTGEDEPAFLNEDKAPNAQVKGEREADSVQLSGTVMRVAQDGKGFSLELTSKVAGGSGKKSEIIITDKTQLVFSNVGPNEACLKEGYRASVWLEKGSKDMASRVYLSGSQNAKNAPHRTGKVIAVLDDGKGITLGKANKGELAEKFAIQFTDQTRELFSNVPRDGATKAVGYEGLVWLESDSPDTAKSVTFRGTAEEKPAETKEQKADRHGRIIGLSKNGQVLTVEILPTKIDRSTTTEIKLTDVTNESYHGVATDGAKPVEGYLVQVWLTAGSHDTAARVRFFRDDPRQNVDGRIIAVSADGERLTLEIPSRFKGGEPTKREIKTTARTKLTFFDVGPGGAQMTEGYHVRGWLAEGSDDSAEELTVSRSGKGE